MEIAIRENQLADLQLPDEKKLDPYEYHKQRFNMFEPFRRGGIIMKEKMQRDRQLVSSNGCVLWTRGGENYSWNRNWEQS